MRRSGKKKETQSGTSRGRGGQQKIRGKIKESLRKKARELILKKVKFRDNIHIEKEGRERALDRSERGHAWTEGAKV